MGCLKEEISGVAKTSDAGTAVTNDPKCHDHGASSSVSAGVSTLKKAGHPLVSCSPF
jgi:hypothetical protein